MTGGTNGSGPAPTADSSRTAVLRTTLERLRAHPRYHPIALIGAFACGLVLAWIHWVGLVAGGALVGLVSRSFPRALVAAVGFGAVVLSVFVLSLGGASRLLLEMAPAVYVTLGAALGLPLLGALLRGVV